MSESERLITLEEKVAGPGGNAGATDQGFDPWRVKHSGAIYALYGRLGPRFDTVGLEVQISMRLAFSEIKITAEEGWRN